jgi:hypothetical protein
MMEREKALQSPFEPDPNQTPTTADQWKKDEEKRQQKKGKAAVEEQERYHRQQEQLLSPSIPPTAIQNQPPPDVSPYPTDPTFQSQPMNITDDEETTTTLSQETRLKIEELKRLVYKYPQYHYNPNAVIKWATYCSNDGDNTFLDEKLEQLRMIDSVMGYPRM